MKIICVAFQPTFVPSGEVQMPDKKSGDFDETSIRELAKDKPVVYHLDNAQGKTLYTGVAKRGRVSDRLSEHLPGGIDPIKGAARVRIQQKASIADAEKAEAKAIKSLQPPQNKRGK
jgi:predicted GIY-YIG superfamily endonuclease